MSARTVEIQPFSEEETRLLLTDPLKHSHYWGERKDRPKPGTAFWGEAGPQRVHAEAGGWPHLVQLIAETAVDLANERGWQTLPSEAWEEVLDRAVVAGNNVLLHLVEKESRTEGERICLDGFAAHDIQEEQDRDTLRRLIRRLLVVPCQGGWRLRVPLMGRWLRA